MSGLGSGLVNLFKQWGKGIGKAADNLLLDAEARKAISDEVRSKFKPKIDLAREAENKRAANITELGKKLAESKDNWQKAQDKWRQNRDAELATAKAQRQTDIDNYNAQLKTYNDALDNANASRDSILNQLRYNEANYDPSRTIFTDVNTGKKYIFNPLRGEYKDIRRLPSNEQKKILKHYSDYENRLLDKKSGNVINAFDKSDVNSYGKIKTFNEYLNKVKAQDINLRDAENQIKQANNVLNNWKSNNSKPQAWDNSTDLQPFKQNFESKYGSIPDEYNFNGQTYTKEADLDNAYQQALKHEEALQNSASKIASKHISNQKAEIAQRIQDAKDIKKAKLALGALGAGAGIGALYAGAKAMYGGDDTDNGDTPDNIDNTDNTYTGKPDHDFNVEKEGQAILKDRQQIDTDFDPNKAEAEAILAGAAYDKGVEDGSSVRSSDDLGNNIGATTRGHTMDDRLYELIKAMKDPYKADAVANYIYSRHGDDPEVQNLGWRGWLNKYYGDSLRSIMNIDPSGYKGMHVSGGL